MVSPYGAEGESFQQLPYQNFIIILRKRQTDTCQIMIVRLRNIKGL